MRQTRNSNSSQVQSYSKHKCTFERRKSEELWPISDDKKKKIRLTRMALILIMMIGEWQIVQNLD